MEVKAHTEDIIGIGFVDLVKEKEPMAAPLRDLYTNCQRS